MFGRKKRTGSRDGVVPSGESNAAAETAGTASAEQAQENPRALGPRDESELPGERSAAAAPGGDDGPFRDGRAPAVERARRARVRFFGNALSPSDHGAAAWSSLRGAAARPTMVDGPHG